MGEIVHASQFGKIWSMDALSAELSRTKSKNLNWSLSHWSCWQRHPTNKIMEKDRGIYLWLLKLLPSDCWKIINFIHPQFRVSSISSVRSCLLNVCHFYKSLLRPAWNFLARYMCKTCCRAENKHEPLFWLSHANRNKIEGRRWFFNCPPWKCF